MGCRCWSGLRYSCRLARPYQHLSITIAGQFLHLDQFDFQVFEVRIIQVKLAFQGVIGHPPSLSEKVNDLVQYLVKVHHLPL